MSKDEKIDILSPSLPDVPNEDIDDDDLVFSELSDEQRDLLAGFYSDNRVGDSTRTRYRLPAWLRR